MSQATSKQHDPDMLDEYDFSEGGENMPSDTTQAKT